MKKIILLLCIIWISLFSVNNTFAEETENSENWKTIKVSVPIDFSSVLPEICNQGMWPQNKWEKAEYYCEVPKWTTGFQVVMAGIIKYLIFITSLAWVLFIVLNWILYSMSWMDDSMKTDSKTRIMKTIIWVVLLLLSWVILHIIAPWIYK